MWKLGKDLRRKLYEIAEGLPAHERYNLAAQIRTAAISLTSDIAKGFGRYHYKEDVQFFRIARGAACELMDHLMTCLDEDDIPTAQHEMLCQDLGIFLRVLNAYFKAIGPSETSLNRS